jgi:hypothetical protein
MSLGWASASFVFLVRPLLAPSLLARLAFSAPRAERHWAQSSRLPGAKAATTQIASQGCVRSNGALDSPRAEIIPVVEEASVMTIALLIALAGSLALMAVIVKRLEQA